MQPLALALVLAITGAAAWANEHPARGDDPSPTAPAPTAVAGSLIICHAPPLADAAEQWATHRQSQGWRTSLLPFHAAEQLTAAQSAAILKHLLMREIATARTATPDRPVAILLLGDAPHHAESVVGLLPTFRFEQPDPYLVDGDDPRYASDQPFQVVDTAGDHAEVMLGRIPARTNAQAIAVLNKIIAFEQATANVPWPMHVEYVAGEGHFGVLDRLLETLFLTMVNQLVPDRCTIHVSYAKPDSIYCPPPAQLTQTVLEQLSTPSMLFNYVGHGSERGFDSLRWGAKRYRMLTVDDLANLPGEAPATPLALLTCCSSGWFDLPEAQHSLAEAMLFHPAGPPAVIAGSRPTHPYANAVMQHTLTEALLSGRFTTLGELDLHATQPERRSAENRQLDAIAGPIAIGMRWPVTLSKLRAMHAQLYNLLGDPTMRLPRPPRPLDSLTLRDGSLIGVVGGIERGEVTITIESDRTRPARQEALTPVISRHDPDLPAKAARNHVLANERVIAMHHASLSDGRFALPLDVATLPPNARMIRVVIHSPGTNRDDHAAILATDTLNLPLWTRLRR